MIPCKSRHQAPQLSWKTPVSDPVQGSWALISYSFGGCSLIFSKKCANISCICSCSVYFWQHVGQWGSCLITFNGNERPKLSGWGPDTRKNINKEAHTHTHTHTNTHTYAHKRELDKEKNTWGNTWHHMCESERTGSLKKWVKKKGG